MSQYLLRFYYTLKKYLSSFLNIFEIASLIMTILMFQSWYEALFNNELLQAIGNKDSLTNSNNFGNFQNLSTLIISYESYKAITSFFLLCKLMIFFFLPKNTSIFIQIYILSFTYIFFFVGLYFLVFLVI